MLIALALHALAGFIIALITGSIALPLLKRLQLRQHAYEDAPQSHRVKTGTPTMGGIVFIVPFIVAGIVGIGHDPFSGLLAFLVVACGVIGMIDDLLGITRGRNRGLRARTKLLLTALAAIIFLRFVSDSYVIFPRDTLFHAGAYALVAPHWLWLILGIVAVTGTINAVNLTDGLDGLATGTMIPPLLVFSSFATPKMLRRSASVRASPFSSSTAIRRRCSWAIPARSRSARCSRESRFSKARCCC
jgi:phospho-N-acetylmuramoyl-pentapeptide-transferase